MTSASKGRAIVIGAGHNGLTCAAYLAKGGMQVTVLEASGQVGGAAITREFTDGFRVSAGAHLLYALSPDVRRELALERYGLRLAAEGLSTIGLHPDGEVVAVRGDQLEGPGALDSDREAMRRYAEQMNRFAAIVWGLKDQLPPRLGTKNTGDLLSLAKLGLRIRRLGTDDMREFLRIAGINVYDVLEERFDSDLLKGTLSLDGTLGSFLGPRSNNSVFCALHRFNQGQGYAIPEGGMGTVSIALDGAARAAGAQIRTGARVANIRMDFDRVCGVTLEDGEELDAGLIISSADPVTTFERLLGPRHLEAGFANRVHHIRNRGCVAKLHLALDGTPMFTGLDGEQRGQRLVIAPDLDTVERAFNHAKYGEYSANPIMEISVPTVFDDTLAPSGKHVLSANVQWAPHDLAAGWSEARDDFEALCLDTLEAYAPGLREQVVASELLTPADLEAGFGMTGGHWHHGEFSLDSFFMLRPVPGAAQYHTPVNGLFLCGAGSHPGGGVMGCAGRNAAKAVLDQA
ncbi:MAG: NAD(P)/FAD-dependent oxidoreductase [Xanthomonadales bacterium]|jgi:phytoene dehydrogenase-like protein|nr:NAD(P)/FAD-dependent oxidoreductase [Xanthomonadales bacterium]